MRMSLVYLNSRRKTSVVIAVRKEEIMIEDEFKEGVSNIQPT